LPLLFVSGSSTARRKRKEQNETDESSTAVGFRAAYVFDISQTDGQGLPTIGSVNGDPREYHERLAQFVADQGIAFDYSEEIAPARGTSSGGKITLLPGQSPAEEFATLAHAIAGGSKGREQMLFVLLGATGMRIGEALGLEIEKHISSDFSTLHIRQKVWRGQIQPFLKSENGIRDVDLPTSIAAMLKEFVGDRTSGLLFCSKNGLPLLQSNLLRLSLHPLLKELNQPKMGAHAFRRFRTTWLRKQHAPEDLLRFWLGHANKSVTDGYSKLKEDVPFRKKVVEQVGIGFELPADKREVAPNCTQSELLSTFA
jgi:integrase